MVYQLLFSIGLLGLSVCWSGLALGITGHVYLHMTYSTSDSPLAELFVTKKFICAAQCAYHFLTCNTAVFIDGSTPRCLLYSEPLIRANLVTAMQATVYDFIEEKLAITTTTSTSPIIDTSSTPTSLPMTSETPFYFSGVLRNVSLLSVQQPWTLCYTATYSTPLSAAAISSVLTLCYQNKLLLGCLPIGSLTLTVAAMGNRSDVLFNCGTSMNCTRQANGVSWYYSNSYSWGFANGNDAVTRAPCDLESTNDDSRLCWHTQGYGGFRCGATINLNSSSSWSKVIYQSN
ncbi:unnamed protein product [Adineta ricciae]|uniref:C-type lectin domain-containing protein n=1 Tax=Adineta ricciae TaxID=249248 RepID=A0A814F5W7_ADIRI|nr:unnamed protein product [Adineta ricciae]CAF1080055.1 unnamed protein product [Adineta ricciae]